MAVNPKTGRWYQFSLKQLLTAVTVVAVCIPLIPLLLPILFELCGEASMDISRWLSDKHEKRRKKRADEGGETGSIG